MAVKKIAKNIKFEEALAELEEQVRLLESGELSLETALRYINMAWSLARFAVASWRQ